MINKLILRNKVKIIAKTIQYSKEANLDYQPNKDKYKNKKQIINKIKINLNKWDKLEKEILRL